MKHSPLSVLLLVTLLSLTFSSEKVFSMDYFWPKKKTSDPVRNEAQARFQESRAEAGSEDTSGAVARGVLESGRGPSEQRKAAPGNEGSEAAVDAVVNVEEEQEGRPYPSDRKLSTQQQAYLHLRCVQDKYTEAQVAFNEAGQLSETLNVYSSLLNLWQRQIDTFTSMLQQAEQKIPAEQASAFEQALQYIKDKTPKLYSSLNSAMEDAAAAHERNQLKMYNTLKGKVPNY